MTADVSAPALLADLGATNVRFGLAGAGGITAVALMRCADHESLQAAIAAYLAQIRPPVLPKRAAIAIACPVLDDRVEMTNLPWAFSISELRAQFGFDRLEVVNDFLAVALAVPHLQAGDVVQVGGGAPIQGEAIAILGPGTGLGVSSLVPMHGRWRALPGEGGHVTMAPANDREAAVLAHLRRRFAHVSAERVISGMGLVNLYESLAAIDGVDDAPMRAPHEVSEAAVGGSDPHCAEAVQMFCAMLGTVAGNHALTVGARGGVYIGGGIVPRLLDTFLQSGFRQRFDHKGRLSDFVQPIPCYVITTKLPALLGLRSVLEDPQP